MYLQVFNDGIFNLCCSWARLNNSTKAILPWRCHNIRCFAIKYLNCAVIDSTQKQQKCDLLLRQYCKDHATRNQVYAVVDSGSTTTQKESSSRYGLSSGFVQWEIKYSDCWFKINNKTNWVCHEGLVPSNLRWKIKFVLLLNQTQRQHKSDIPFHMAYFKVFCNEKSELCCCWVWVNNNTKVMYHCKKCIFERFAMINHVCAAV